MPDQHRLTPEMLVPRMGEYLIHKGLITAENLKRALDYQQERMVRGDSILLLSTDVVKEVKSHFPGLVFQSIVPRSIRLAEAPSYGLPISAYSPTSVGARAYQALAKELLQGDGVITPS